MLTVGKADADAMLTVVALAGLAVVDDAREDLEALLRQAAVVASAAPAKATEHLLALIRRLMKLSMPLARSLWAVTQMRM